MTATSKRQPRSLGVWLVGAVVGLTSIVQAEDVTVTTYYPSPRGNYQTLNATDQTNLATSTTSPTARVGIGTTGPNEQLELYKAQASGRGSFMRLSSNGGGGTGPGI